MSYQLKITQQLKLHEGYKNTPYEDTEGHLTIGVGHNLSKPLSNAVVELILEEDINTNFSYRIKKFGFLLIICLATGFIISPLFVLIEELGFVDMQEHAMEDLMKKLSKPVIFVFAHPFLQ